MDDCLGWVVRCAVDLVLDPFTPCGVDRDDVGERAARIDGYLPAQ